MKEKRTLEQRLSGDDLLNAQNLISELSAAGAKINHIGLVTVYHRTSKKNADDILKTGNMFAKEDGLFFSTKETGQNKGYGDTAVAFEIPVEKIVIDNLFSDEAQVRLPLESNKSLDVTDYIIGKQNRRLFVDMDGTLAKFSFVPNDTLYQKGYFKNLEPIESVLSAVKQIQKSDNGIDVYTMSAYLSDSNYALEEKNQWLDEHFPELDKEHRVFVPCGENKKDYLPDGIQESDFLLDDFTENLNTWLPNMGIKILNGINHTKCTWKGNMISYEKEPVHIAKDIVNVMNGEQIKDIAPLNYEGLDKTEWQEFLEKDEYYNKHRQNLLKAVKKYLGQGYEKETVKYLARCEARYIKLDEMELNKDMSLEEIQSIVNEQIGVVEIEMENLKMDEINNDLLTKEQEEYFKESIVRDEQGKLLKMYHGTPFNDFNFFRSGTHFTANKEYAHTYENVGASSSGISSRKLINGADLSPITYETYLNITNPFSLEDEECLDIFINEYIKGGNAQGINPYLDEEEYERMFEENPVIDWTEAENLQEFLEDNGYDYDGLIVSEGGNGGYGMDVEDRGIAYVVFYPEQVKLTSDKMPLPVKEFKKDEQDLTLNEETQQQFYRYYSTQRPVSIGTYPKSQKTINMTNFNERKIVDEIGREAWGYVEYESPLTEQEMNQYELVLADGQAEREVLLDSEMLEHVGVRPLNGDEKYVFMVRRASNGQYHTGWTGNFAGQLNNITDKDKVLGCYILPNRMSATAFKHKLSKMGHMQINTLLLYPDRIKDVYKGDLEVVNVDALNEAINLDADPVKREFPFMRSENDFVNELYNGYVNKFADEIKRTVMYDVDISDEMMKNYADSMLVNRIGVLEKAMETNFTVSDMDKLMSVDTSKEDFMKYSLEQAEFIAESGAETLIVGDKSLIPTGIFEDIEIADGQIAEYMKDGLNGRYLMQIKSDGRASLYTVESFSALPFVSQLILSDYEPSELHNVLDLFNQLDENIEDEVLGERISSFVREAGGQNVSKEDVVTMLTQADSAGLDQLLNEITNTDMNSKVQVNQLKEMIKYNAKAFDRKNLEQFITRAKTNIRTLDNIPDYISNNISSLRTITKEIPHSLEYLPDSAKSDLECVMSAVTHDGKDFIYAKAELRENLDIIKTALKTDKTKSIISYISKENLNKVILKSNFDVPNIDDISTIESLVTYFYTKDEISGVLISNYFDKHRDNEDGIFKVMEDKWNSEDVAVLKEPKTAILKLRETKENEALIGYTLEDLRAEGIEPDISNYEIVYIEKGYTKSNEDISRMFRLINGIEKPQNFYGDAMGIGDIVVTTRDGFNFESYYVDMDNNKLDKKFTNLITERMINDYIDVKVEKNLLQKFDKEDLLDEPHKERLNILDNLYTEYIKLAGERTGEVKEENRFELSKDEKNSLKKTDIAENRQGILPHDRMTYKKEDGEVILKKGVVKDKEEFVQKTESLNQKETVIKNLSLTYAIESSIDYIEMINEYPPEDIKEGTNYRLVQIDRISGKIVRVDDNLFSSKEVAENYFNTTINNPNTGRANRVLVDYETMVSKSFEVASMKKNNDLLKGIQNVMDSESFKGWCTARANQFPNKYSLNNALAIYMQNPDASIVFGARQWQDYGRQVKKGAKAMRITIPSKFAYQKQNGALMSVISKNIKDSLAEKEKSNVDGTNMYGTYRLGDSNLTFIGSKNGLYSMLINDSVVLSNVDEKTLSHYLDTKVVGKVPVAFAGYNVFDISMVEEPEYLAIRNPKEEDKKDFILDEKGNPQKTRTGAYKVRNTEERKAKLNTVLDMQIKDATELNVAEIYKTLKLISEKNGVPVSEADVLSENGARGYYSRTGNNIVIEQTLSPTAKIATCIHEIAHSRMHKDGANIARNLKEVQAETVSYIVNKSLGINTDTKSFNYISSWMGSRRMTEIKQSLELINKEASTLYKDIVNDLSERGVNLKLDEFMKENTLEKEVNKGKTNEQTFNKQAVVNEFNKMSAKYLEMETNIKVKGDDAKELIAVEQNADIIVIRENISDIYQSALNETKEVNVLIMDAITEANSKDPDINKLNDIKQQIVKAEERINTAKQEISINESRVSEMKTDRNTMETSNLSQIEKLRFEFNNNSLNALNMLKKENAKLADLEKNQLFYLSVSPFVKEALEQAIDVKSFVDLCAVQAENAEHVKSKKDVFVEIVDSEYADLKKGNVMHIKVADKEVEKIEKGVRKLKEDALKHKELVPSVTVVVNIYSTTEKGNLMSLSNLKLNLGNKKQDNLISAIENRTRSYSKYQPFVEDCKASCKERNVQKEKQTPPVPNIERITEHNNFLRESKRKEREKSEKKELKEVENHRVKSSVKEQDSLSKDMNKDNEKKSLNKNSDNLEM